MRSSNGRLAYGTSGNPQTHIMQETYAAKVAENEAKLKAEANAAPLTDRSHLAELEANSVRFTREDVILRFDRANRLVGKRSRAAGYAHSESRGHVGQIAKKSSLSESEVPRLLRNIIRDGRIVSNKIRETNGGKGYERIYEYDNERILLTGIGINGFIVSAYPLKSRTAK